jgi:hypothetical protein
MKRYLILLVALSYFQVSNGQPQKTYLPKIEPCSCAFKTDSNFKTRCGYLVVPENRQKPTGKTIKLPFIYVECNNPDKKSLIS